MTGGRQHIVFDEGPGGVRIAQGCRMGRDVSLGRNVTVYPEVALGDEVVVLDGAVLGRLPIATRTMTRAVKSEFSLLAVGTQTVIGSNAVLYTGSHIGGRAMIGDLSSLREGCRIGDGAVLGRGVMALYNCSVGRFSRIQDQCHLVGDLVVEDHVFVGMGVVTTNDNDVYLSRFGLVADSLRAPHIRRYAVIGAGATILPGLEIGEGSLVAAGCVVTRDVPPWTIVRGIPGRVTGEVPADWRERVVARAQRMEEEAGAW